MGRPVLVDPPTIHLTHDSAVDKRGSIAAIRFNDPKDAIAFRRWLGKLEHRRKLLRSPTIPINPSKSVGLAGKLERALYPWTIHQYPGKNVMLAWVMGVKLCTVKGYRSGKGIPPETAQRAAVWCRGKAAELVALAGELEQDAAEKIAKRPPPVTWQKANAARERKRLAREAAREAEAEQASQAKPR